MKIYNIKLHKYDILGDEELSKSEFDYIQYFVHFHHVLTHLFQLRLSINRIHVIFGRLHESYSQLIK